MNSWHHRRFGAAVLLLLLGSFAVAAEPLPPPSGPDLITWTAEVRPEDPFSPANLVGAKAGPIRRGERFLLTVTGTPKAGYYTYGLTRRTSNQDAGQLSVVTYEPNPAFQPLWPITETDLIQKPDGLGGTLWKHDTPFTWSQEILVSPDAPPGDTTLRLSIKAQVCSASCVDVVRTVEVPVTISGEEALPLTPALQERMKQTKPEPEVVGGVKSADPETPGGPAPTRPRLTNVPEVVEEADPRDAIGTGAAGMGVLGFIGLGLFWGFISLVTPCVFPMIPITVSIFLKQSEQRHHRPLLLAAVYSGTIVIVLTLGGLLLMQVMQPFSQHWATNFGLGVLFLVFALSLFGMYEIVLPSGLARLTQSQEGRGGLGGIIFMALTFTIISFTCVAPFYGSFIAFASQDASAGNLVKLTLGALAYSAAFASPFFFLALFPSAIKKMPRSGSWMNAIKVVMGFIEIAAAIKFLRAGELNLVGKPVFLTYDLCLALYVTLCVLACLYLLKLYNMPHDYEDTPTPLSVSRLLWAFGFLSLGIHLTPGLWKHSDGEPQQPDGTVFAWVNSFLLPDEVQWRDKRLEWGGDLAEALERAWQDPDKRKRVFIDFTGMT